MGNVNNPSFLGYAEFGPAGGGVDDALRFVTLAQQVAYSKAIVFQAGTYNWATTQRIPSGTVIYGNPGATILSTLAPTGSVISGIFFHVPTAQTITTLDAVPVKGSPTVTVASIGSLIVGDYIAFNDPANHVAGYQIQAIAGNVITLDRPVMTDFAIGNAVLRRVPPQDIKIHGNGMRLQGTGDTAIELSGAWRCLVEGLRIDGTFAETVLNMDVGAYRSRVRDCEVLCTTAKSGINLESSEFCILEGSSAIGPTAGILITNSYAAIVSKCRASNCSRGLQLNDGSSNTFSARNITIDGCFFDNNINFGIEMTNGSKEVYVSNTECRYNGGPGIAVNIGDFVTNDILLTNINCSFNGTHGLYVATGSMGVKVSNITALNNGLFGILLDGDASITNAELRENNQSNGNGGGIAVMGTARLQLSNFSIVATHAFFHSSVRTTSSGLVQLSNGRLELTVGGGNKACISATSASGGVYATNLKSVGGNNGWIASGSSFRRGPNVDFSSTITPYSGGSVSFGTLTLNGATPVDLAFTDAKTTDRPRARRTSLAGTPGHFTCTAVNGVGIRLTGTAGDTSTVEVDLI